MLVLSELSDEQIERLAKLPLVTKAMLFGKAEEWYAQNKTYLHDNYQGKTPVFR